MLGITNNESSIVGGYGGTSGGSYVQTPEKFQTTKSNRPFKLGFMLGRFQHIHIGHEMLIRTALSACDKVVLLVGSAQEEGTLRNPFGFQKRMELIKKVFENDPRLIISYIDDLTHENDHSTEWGKYVLNRVSEVTIQKGIFQNPDVMIFGNDEERSTWFDPEDIKNISQLVINRGNIDISATKIRDYIINDKFWLWRQYVNIKIEYEFQTLRNMLLELDAYKEVQK